MRTTNPALSEAVFSKARHHQAATDSVMTLNGTVNKSFILIGLLLFTAVFSWYQAVSGAALAMPIAIGGAIGGFIIALITVFKRSWSPVTAPLYALAEGLFLGGISAVFEAAFEGIVIQAVVLTIGVFISLLLAYKSGLIKVTENFKLGVFAATGAIALIYLATWILGMFGTSIPYIHGSGTIGILFSVGVVIVASLNLVLDFDFIEQGAASNAPKYMEWYASFGLLVTLVWLYLAILRLLSKIRE